MNNQAINLMAASDKVYWHGYLDFYESRLPFRVDGVIVEFGVFKGDSIRWLRHRYPSARIIGVDILPVQPYWPQEENITYRQLDQGDDQAVRDFFATIEPPAIILEDGSHVPAHQSRCLKLGFARLMPGGVYILENIDTSHPAHSLYKKEFADHAGGWINRVLRYWFGRDEPRGQTSLSVLLGLEHLRRRGRGSLSEEELEMLSEGAHFSRDDIRRFNELIESMEFYRRSKFPSRCFACGGSHFDYHRLRCSCGVDLLGEADSMSVCMTKAERDGARP
ncbi:MAG: hypothetical protein ACO398_10985 [Kiritimatiellia bacterium]